MALGDWPIDQLAALPRPEVFRKEKHRRLRVYVH